jgi:hypothetical protein
VIYLDHNATTPIAPDVVAAIRPYLERHFGNPSSAHAYGAAAPCTTRCSHWHDDSLPARLYTGLDNLRASLAGIRHGDQPECLNDQQVGRAARTVRLLMEHVSPSKHRGGQRP